MLTQLSVFTLLAVVFITGGIRAQIQDIEWVELDEKDLLSSEEHSLAFRDVLFEEVLKQVITSIFTNAKLPENEMRIPGQLKIDDPMYLSDVSFVTAKAGLYSVDFKATNLKLTGLHNFKVKNLHVLRHIGLRDLRVLIQIIGSLNLCGMYDLKGSGVSLLAGSGPLNMTISDFMWTLESFAVYNTKENSLKLRSIDLNITEENIDVHMENLSGLVGADNIATVIGSELIYRNSGEFQKAVREIVENFVNSFLILPKM
jgi:hypothetical protein